MKREINWGIIGLGRMANVFAQSIVQVDNSTLCGISSKNPERLKNFSESYDVDPKYCFGNYQSLLSCKEIDIIYVALPNSFHLEWILKCIEADKNVLVEKPATMNSSEFRIIRNRIQAKTLFFSEGFMYLHHPRTQQFIRAVKKGLIGEPIEMETSFGCKILEKDGLFKTVIRKFKKEPRQFNKTLGGGCILDLGCYLTSLSLIIAKIKSNHDIDALRCDKTRIDYNSKKVDLEAQTELLFENGFKSRIQTSFQKDFGQTTSILGSNGKMVITDTWSCETDGFLCNDNYVRTKSTKFANPYSHQIFNISNCLLQNIDEPPSPSLNLNDSLDNMRLLDKWRNSLGHKPYLD
jgi:predicted dehydrogenase